MMDFTQHIVLSVSDLCSALKREWKAILLAALVCASLLVFRQLNKPTSYTAEASYLLKGSSDSSGGALKLLAGISSEPVKQRDAEFTIQSNAVISKVAYELGLQASLQEKGIRTKGNPRMETMWQNFLIAKAYRHYGKKPVLSKPIFHDQEPSFQCHHVKYENPDFSTILDIAFLDKQTFEVFKDGALMGTGRLDTPFVFDQGEFTLKGIPRKEYQLSLVPMQEVICSFKKQLSVVAEKGKKSYLLPIAFQHSSPFQAQKTLNALLKACQEELKNEGHERIAHQLTYLEQQKTSANQDLESLLNTYKAHLTTSINQGESPAAKGDEQLLIKIQSKCYEDQAKTLLYMQNIYAQIFGENIPLRHLVEKAQNTPLDHVSDKLTTLNGLQLITEYETQLEKLHLKKNQSLNLIDQLRSDVTSPTLLVSSALTFDLDLKEVIELMEKLQDTENYSQAERDGIQRALNHQKKTLISILENFHTGFGIEEASCKERMLSLQKQTLALLLQDYETAEQTLLHVGQKLNSLPDKWAQEEKLDLTKQIHLAKFTELSKLIESKNLAYHLDFLETRPYTWATLPLLPKSPKLELLAFVGAFVGIFLMASWICLKEVYKGPSASFENLSSAGCHAIGTLSSNHLQLVVNQLGSAHSIFVNSIEFKELKALFERRGETVLWIDEPKEEVIGSKGFAFDQSYDKVIVCHFGLDSLSALLSERCDQTLFVVGDERAKELTLLSQDTFYLFKQKEKRIPFLSLQEIRPILQRFFSASLQQASASNTTSKSHDKQSHDPAKT